MGLSLKLYMNMAYSEYCIKIRYYQKITIYFKYYDIIRDYGLIRRMKQVCFIENIVYKRCCFAFSLIWG